MPSITISIPLNQRQHNKLEKWLVHFNSQRRRTGLLIFPSYNAAIRDFVIRKLKASVQSADADDSRDVKRKYLDASEDRQRQVREILRGE